MSRRKAIAGLAAAMLLVFASTQVQAGVMCKTKKKGGDVHHNGTDGSMCEAVADNTSKSQARAAGSGSFAESNSDSHGKAKSTATSGGNAQAEAFGDPGSCKATANASGGATALAQCEAGGFVNAIATGTGMAMGFDDKAPTCDPGANGTATVHSSFGNCP
jgi:hypothetical protein